MWVSSASDGSDKSNPAPCGIAILWVHDPQNLELCSTTSLKYKIDRMRAAAI